jgi:iron(II)-dependent oxidoreductase
VHNALLDRLAGQVGSGLTPEERYFYQRVLFAEDMQGEAFLRLRQLRGDPRPDLVDTNAGLDPDDEPRAGALAGDVTVPGGTFRLGAEGEAPFVFDNEKWAHEVALAPFAIARAPVTNAEFAAFVADGGYAEPRFWDEAGWQWRESLGIRHPLAWVDDGGGHWFQRDFDGRRPLPMEAPVSQVSLHEAEAFCRWAGRRLPTEAEWEAAAAAEPEGAGLASAKRMYPWGEGRPTMDRANLDARYLGPLDVADCPGGESALGARQMLGNVWEWTASAFAPYPGFTPDPDPDYSQRGFGGAQVLRGGSWATRGRVVRSTLRGFAHPWRNDLFAGFRTCALDPEGE